MRNLIIKNGAAIFFRQLFPLASTTYLLPTLGADDYGYFLMINGLILAISLGISNSYYVASIKLILDSLSQTDWVDKTVLVILKRNQIYVSVISLFLIIKPAINIVYSESFPCSYNQKPLVMGLVLVSVLTLSAEHFPKAILTGSSKYSCLLNINIVSGSFLLLAIFIFAKSYGLIGVLSSWSVYYLLTSALCYIQASRVKSGQSLEHSKLATYSKDFNNIFYPHFAGSICNLPLSWALNYYLSGATVYGAALFSAQDLLSKLRRISLFPSAALSEPSMKQITFATSKSRYQKKNLQVLFTKVSLLSFFPTLPCVCIAVLLVLAFKSPIYSFFKIQTGDPLFLYSILLLIICIPMQALGVAVGDTSVIFGKSMRNTLLIALRGSVILLLTLSLPYDRFVTFAAASFIGYLSFLCISYYCISKDLATPLKRP